MYCRIKLNRRIIAAFAAAVCFATVIWCAVISDDIATAADADREISLPIVMYHSMLKDEKLQGKYVISPDLFEKDLEYLTQNGYTTITVKQLTDYVYNATPLPEKPVMLTFDDGYYNNYCYAFPLLKKYGCKALISPICSVSEQFSENEDKSPSYGHCTFDELKEMCADGVFELGNHSYNMHQTTGRFGASQKNGETLDQYKEAMRKDVLTAQEMLIEKTGLTAECFVYPFGQVSEKSDEILKEMGFKASMICLEKTNVITRDKDCLYSLGRYLRDNKESPQAFFERIDD